MKRKGFGLSLVSILALSTLLTACGSGEQAQGEAPEAKAQQLVIYSGRKEELMKPIIETFEKEHQVKVVVQYGAASEMANKIREEKGAPKADLILTNDAGSVEKLRMENLLQPFDGGVAKDVPADLKAEDNTWTGVGARNRVIMYNKDRVKEDELPRSMFDLVKPEYKGQVAMAQGGNESVVGQLTAMRVIKGDAATEKWIKELKANGVAVLSGHGDVRKAVGKGEFKFGIVNNYYAHQQLAEKENNHIGIIYPDQGEGEMGSLVNVAAAGIVQGAPNKELAEKFIAYLLKPETQKLFAELNKEIPVIAGVPVVEGAKSIDQFKRTDIPLSKLGTEMDATIQVIDAAGGLPVKQN